MSRQDETWEGWTATISTNPDGTYAVTWTDSQVMGDRHNGGAYATRQQAEADIKAWGQAYGVDVTIVDITTTVRDGA